MGIEKVLEEFKKLAPNILEAAASNGSSKLKSAAQTLLDNLKAKGEQFDRECIQTLNAIKELLSKEVKTEHTKNGSSQSVQYSSDPAVQLEQIRTLNSVIRNLNSVLLTLQSEVGRPCSGKIVEVENAIKALESLRK
jgi:hypothetical protein